MFDNALHSPRALGLFIVPLKLSVRMVLLPSTTFHRVYIYIHYIHTDQRVILLLFGNCCANNKPQCINNQQSSWRVIPVKRESAVLIVQFAKPLYNILHGVTNNTYPDYSYRFTGSLTESFCFNSHISTVYRHV